MQVANQYKNGMNDYIIPVPLCLLPAATLGYKTIYQTPQQPHSVLLIPKPQTPCSIVEQKG